ncbi:unnamed protein product [Amoebophrya sp. A25]|nr:unnamed protein product [Amoebophrya sp. A25]|eukprot:GSA25T00020224001.1
MASTLFYYYACVHVSLNYATLQRNPVNLEHAISKRILYWAKQTVAKKARTEETDDGVTSAKCLVTVMLGSALRLVASRHQLCAVAATESACSGGSSATSTPVTQGHFLPAAAYGTLVEAFVHCLLKVAKETSEPIRSYMLHGIAVAMCACGWSYFPHLKDTLRLSAAHLLADTFDNPQIACALAHILQAACGTVVDPHCGIENANSSCSRSNSKNSFTSTTTTSSAPIFKNMLNKDLGHRVSIIWIDLVSQAATPWLLLCRSTGYEVSLLSLLLVLESSTLLNTEYNNVNNSTGLMRTTTTTTENKTAIKHNSSEALRTTTSSTTTENKTAITSWPLWQLCSGLFCETALEPGGILSAAAAPQKTTEANLVSLFSGSGDLSSASGGTAASTSQLYGRAVRQAALRTLAPHLLAVFTSPRTTGTRTSTTSVGVGGTSDAVSLTDLSEELDATVRALVRSYQINSGGAGAKIEEELLDSLVSITCSTATNSGGDSSSSPPSSSPFVVKEDHVDRWIDRVHQVVLGQSRKRRLRRPVERIKGSKTPISGEPDSGLQSGQGDAGKKDHDDLGENDSESIVKQSGALGRDTGDAFVSPPFLPESQHFDVKLKCLFLKFFRKILNDNFNSFLLAASSSSRGGATTSTSSISATPLSNYYMFEYVPFLETTSSINTTTSSNITRPVTEVGSGLLKEFASLWLTRCDSLVSLVCKSIAEAESMPSLMTEALLCLLSVIRLFGCSTDADLERSKLCALSPKAHQEEDDGEILVNAEDEEPVLLQFEAQIGNCVRRVFRSLAAETKGGTTSKYLSCPRNLYLISVIQHDIVRTKITSSPEKALQNLAAGVLSAPSALLYEKVAVTSYLLRLRLLASCVLDMGEEMGSALRSLSSSTGDGVKLSDVLLTALQDCCTGLSQVVPGKGGKKSDEAAMTEAADQSGGLSRTSLVPLAPVQDLRCLEPVFAFVYADLLRLAYSKDARLFAGTKDNTSKAQEDLKGVVSGILAVRLRGWNHEEGSSNIAAEAEALLPVLSQLLLAGEEANETAGGKEEVDQQTRHLAWAMFAHILRHIFAGQEDASSTSPVVSTSTTSISPQLRYNTLELASKLLAGAINEAIIAERIGENKETERYVKSLKSQFFAAAQMELVNLFSSSASNVASLGVGAKAASSSDDKTSAAEIALAVLQQVLVSEDLLGGVDGDGDADGDAPDVVEAETSGSPNKKTTKVSQVLNSTLTYILSAESAPVVLRWWRAFLQSVRALSSASVSLRRNFLVEQWAIGILDVVRRKIDGNNSNIVYFVLLLVPLLQDEELFPDMAAESTFLASLMGIFRELLALEQTSRRGDKKSGSRAEDLPPTSASSSSTSTPAALPALQALLRQPKLSPILLPVLFEALAGSEDASDQVLFWTLVPQAIDIVAQRQALAALLLQLASTCLLHQSCGSCTKNSTEEGATGCNEVPLVEGCVLGIARANAAVFKSVLTALPAAQRDALQQGLRRQVAAGG